MTRFRRIAFYAVPLLALVFADTAGAEQTILGVADPVNSGTFVGCGASSCTRLQTALADPTAVTPPAPGRIRGWWAVSPTLAPNVTFRVMQFDPMHPPQFIGEGTSDAETLTTTKTEFPANLPVTPGQNFGLTLPSGASVFDVGDGQANFNTFASAAPDGTDVSFSSQTAAVLQLGERFFFTPVVTSIASTSGPTSGGNSVVITGNHLTDSTQVKFGTTAAPGFTIDDNQHITATAPPASAGVVAVTVTGPGGTSTGATYTFITPAATASPGSLDFGSQDLGHETAFQTVTLTNTGTVPVKVASAAIGSGDAGDFAVFSDDCSGKTFAPGAACSVALTFRPSAVGGRHSILVLKDDGSEHDVALSGTGTTTATAPPPGGGSVAPPSNAFSIGKLKKRKLTISVQAAGTVKVRGRGLKTVTAKGGPGTITVTLKLTRAGATTLRKKHTLRVKTTIVFTPTGGSAATKKVTLKLKR